MKTIIRYQFVLVVAFVIFCTKCLSQTISFSQTQDIEFTKNIKNEIEYSEYVTRDGSALRVGDQLIFGQPSTNRGSFTYLYAGKFSMGNAMLTGIRYLPATSTGESVIIESIFVYHSKMSWKSTLTIMMYVRDPNRPKVGSMRTIMDYERCINLGEVINPNAAMTRQEAINKLKEAKDLLDLEVISKNKYDSLKEALIPIINNN